MNEKTIWLLVFLFLIAGFLFGLKNPKLFSFLTKIKSQKTLLFSKLNVEEINVVEINRGAEKTILQKENDIWKEKNATFSAQKEKIETALMTIKKFNKKSLVSTNPAKRDIFGVDDKGTRVLLKNGEQVLVDFRYGKRGPDFLSTYIKIEGSDEVWLISDVLDSIFSPELWSPSS